MPQLSIDLSINIPLILTLVGMAIALVRLLTRLEDGQKQVKSDLQEHTEREERAMDWIRARCEQFASRLDRIEASGGVIRK